MIQIAILLAFWMGSATVWASSWDVGGGLSVYQFDYRENLPYREDLQAQLKSNELATVVAPFVFAKRPLSFSNPSFVFGRFLGTSATSVFDGTDLNGAPVRNSNSHMFFNGEVDFYTEFAPGWWALAGIGYSYWNRFLSGGTGYREIYTWGVVPLGIRYEASLSPELAWALEASYRMKFASEIVIIFSETVINGQDNHLTLDNRPGFQLQTTLTMTLNPQWKIFFTPWYEQSELGDSDFEYNRTLSRNIKEPSSRTVMMGVASGVTYSY